MAKYRITITGTIDVGDPDLAYLENEGRRFQTPQDVVDYLTDVLADEVVLETDEILVDEVIEKASRKRVAVK